MFDVVTATAERARKTALAILDKLDTHQIGDGEPPGPRSVRDGTARDRSAPARETRRPARRRAPARSKVVTR
ncbi:hypothetical protein [Cellulosimicrobium funkei]|uniref:hypothetical protein n=1 Tax=Cellulosimicrobium funkei TaxID=264251 RepID=UPI001E344FC5|nr:hypothetical protein [Cellulosimicrobium funkei]